ncbi:hypothetical protein V3481_018996 [Fusarium oxysporum f. sp. vasinfectum]
MPFLTAMQQGSDQARPTILVPEFGLILLAPHYMSPKRSTVSRNITPHKHPLFQRSSSQIVAESWRLFSSTLLPAASKSSECESNNFLLTTHTVIRFNKDNRFQAGHHQLLGPPHLSPGGK